MQSIIYKFNGIQRVIFMIGIIFLPSANFTMAGSRNTQYGEEALPSNTQGNKNSAFGFYALHNNTTGSNNTAFGAYTMPYNTTGSYNTAVGQDALVFEKGSDGDYNSVIGSSYFNKASSHNVVVGGFFMSKYPVHDSVVLGNGFGLAEIGPESTGNPINYRNVSLGSGALFNFDQGDDNVAIGDMAMARVNSGSGNVAVGSRALSSDRISFEGEVKLTNNTAVGNNALQRLYSGDNNIAVYVEEENAIIEPNITFVMNNTISIGDKEIDNNTKDSIFIGEEQNKVYVSGISGVNVSNGSPVYVNSSNQLGITGSSEKFKKDIQDINAVSEKLNQLRPVSFIYKKDKSNALQYGLIAEEVAKVYPELVKYDDKGKPFTVYYQFLTPLLLSQWQQDHENLEKEKQLNAARQEKLVMQQNEMAMLESTVDSLSSELDNVQVELAALLHEQQQLANMVSVQKELAQLEQTKKLSTTYVAR